MSGGKHVHTKARFAGGYFRLRDVLAKTSPELKKNPDLVGQQGYISSSVRNLVKNINAGHLVVLGRPFLFIAMFATER